MTDPALSPRALTTVLFAAIALWGTTLAIGAVRYNWNIWRGVVVLACVGGFLGGWLLLLWQRSRRDERGKRS